MLIACPSARLPLGHTVPRAPSRTANYEDTCAFSDYANWLLPGALMVGRYPYVEPSRRARGQQRHRGPHPCLLRPRRASRHKRRLRGARSLSCQALIIWR